MPRNSGKAIKTRVSRKPENIVDLEDITMAKEPRDTAAIKRKRKR
jgi:hypothetical protein